MNGPLEKKNMSLLELVHAALWVSRIQPTSTSYGGGCHLSPPAWLRSAAVKSAIENDLHEHKNSLAKERDRMQVLVDSQNIQDG